MGEGKEAGRGGRAKGTEEIEIGEKWRRGGAGVAERLV